MKKDLIVRGIRASRFIWREAKKPILRMKASGGMTLLPCKESEESGQPRLSYKIDLDLTVVYLLLGLLAIRCVCRAILSFFK